MNPIRTSRWAALALAAAFVGCDNPPGTTSTPSSSPSPAPQPVEKKPEMVKPDDTKPTDMKPAEVKPADTKPADTKPAAKSSDAAPAKKLDFAGAKLTDDEIAEIKKIEPEADRKLAMEQKLCPISGDHLGSMEVPVKVMLKDKTVFLCCGGCVKDAKAKPDETLAKLPK